MTRVSARRALTRSGGALAGTALVVMLAAVALLAPWLAPYDPDEQVDPAIGAARPPFAQLLAVELDDGTVYLAESVRRSVEVVGATDSERGQQVEVLRLIPGGRERDRIEAARVARIAPRRYWLGSDRLGRDVLSRVLWGTRTSLGVGVASAVLALLLGILVGAAAAMGRPALDELLMRAVDGLLAFPALLLVLTLSLFFEPGVVVLVVIIGGTAWMGLSRLVRGELLQLRARPFVLAARSLGAGRLRLLFGHLLPNAWPTIAIAGCLLVGDAILVESAVSFLGLGVASDLPSWGRMVEHGRGDVVDQWWMSTLPGLGIVLTVLAFNLLGDGLRDAFDPRRRRARRPSAASGTERPA